MKIEIPDKILMQGNFSEKDLLIEFAVLLYQKTDFSWAAASKFAGITRDEFLQELAKRKIPVKYSITDLEEDLENFSSGVNDSGK